MCEILFQGKRKDNGEWVEGFLFQTQEHTYIAYAGQFDDDLFLAPENIFIEVVLETVGRYTGLNDNTKWEELTKEEQLEWLKNHSVEEWNGKKIFEGDILAFSDRLVYVHWHDYCGCWDCSYIKAVNGKATSHEDRSPNKWRYNAKVVGKIHDNKPRLKGGTEK